MEPENNGCWSVFALRRTFLIGADMSTRFNAARAYIAAGNLDAARRIAREAMERAPDDVAVWHLMVDIELAAKRWEAAYDLSLRALAQWPNHAELRLGHAITLVYTKRKVEVVQAIRDWERDFPLARAEAHFLHTFREAFYGSTKKARAHFGEFREYCPDSPYVPILDELIAHKANDPLAIERTLKRMAPTVTTNGKVHTRLATVQLDLFKLAAARRSARTALAIEPTRRDAEAILWLSWLVFFPPFFVAHAYFWLDGMRRSLFSGWLVAALKVPLMAVFGLAIIAFFIVLIGGAGVLTGDADKVDNVIYSLTATVAACFFLIVGFAWPHVRAAVMARFARRGSGAASIELAGY